MIFPLPSSARTGAAPAAEKTLVPAAWPSGIASFATVTICDDCAVLDACNDWLKARPGQSDGSPPFCPNASEVKRGKAAGGR